MNKVILIGNLVRDPEMERTPQDIPVCKFSIAVNRRFINSKTGERDADFFNIVAWRNLAENCGKYLEKGRKVCVVGAIENRNFVDKDGNKRYFTDIVADDVEFLTPGNKEGSSGGSDYAGASRFGDKLESNEKGELKAVSGDDDLPF